MRLLAISPNKLALAPEDFGATFGATFPPPPPTVVVVLVVVVVVVVVVGVIERGAGAVSRLGGGGRDTEADDAGDGAVEEEPLPPPPPPPVPGLFILALAGLRTLRISPPLSLSTCPKDAPTGAVDFLLALPRLLDIRLLLLPPAAEEEEEEEEEVEEELFPFPLSSVISPADEINKIKRQEFKFG